MVGISTALLVSSSDASAVVSGTAVSLSLKVNWESEEMLCFEHWTRNGCGLAEPLVVDASIASVPATIQDRGCGSSDVRQSLGC